MVFESLVTDLVNKFLGDFIENLDKSQLKLGIWGGDVVLNNLFVKENAFDELDLPLKVLHGNIGNLTLKIPWSNLYGAPVIANLDGLYVVAVPNLGVKYNAEKEAKAEWDTKQKELSRIEEAKKLQNEKKSEPKADTFAEKMVTQVIKNLQVNITNIHIRFEDHFTNPQRPFSIGVTLNELSFLTTDENWKPAIIKDTVSVIYKMVKLESLALYWNSKTASYLKLNRSQILEKLKHNIAAPGKNLSYQYLIKPITSSAQLRLHTKPENDNYSLPKILLNVLLEEIAIVLAKKQYHDIMELLESFERMTLASKYRKYRPDVTQKKGNAKQWWKFAYRCILEETVKRRRRMWSWSHISSHRRMTKSYKVAYKQKLTAKKPPADLTTKLEYLEKSLNVFDITLARQQAELEVKSEGLKKKKEAAEKGWFGGWFGGGGKKEELKEADASIGDKFEKLMTPEEKAKLYDAIGYQEDAGDVSLPKEFVANCVNVALKSLSLTLKDTDKKHAQVSRIAINDVSASIDQRPAANALKVDGSIQLLTVEGMPVSDQHTPMLLKPQSHNFIQADGNSNVVELGFETNPLDGACDQRVKLTAKPMEIIYDANTVNEIASFFKPPESVYLKQLQASAMAKFEELKEQTASGLQHAIEQHKYTDIHVDIQPTCVLVPDTGVYRQDAKLIIADLGSLSIKSEKPDKTVDIQTTDLSFEEVMSRAYEHFYVNLTSIQVLYALPGEDWRQACTQGISSLHVLQPMSLKINLSKSILQDPKIPKMRVDGELPSISVSMSDVRLHQILDLVRSIPLPEPDPSQPPGDTALHGDTAGALHDPYAIDVSNVAQSGNASSVVRKLNAGLDDSSSSEDEYYDASSKPAKKAIASKKSQEYTNCIDVQLKFVIKEISLSLLERKKNLDVPMMKVVLDNIGTQVKVTTFHLKTEVYLGGVYVQHQQFKAPICDPKTGKKAVNGGPLVNLVNTPTDDNNNKLLTVVYMKANKKNPEFSTTYKNTEQSITVDFTAIELLLHQEALLSVMKFAQSLQPPESPQPTPTDTSPTAATDNKEPSELNEIGKQLAEARRERLMLEEGDVIDLSVSAHLGTINVAVCTEKCFITDVNIKGLQADVMMQKAKIAVSAGLEDIAVFDPTPNAVYSKILTIDGTGVFSAAVTVYNFATKGAGYSDMNNVDTDVKLDTGCMNIVFLNKFVMQILCFLDQFQAAKDAMAEASSAVAESAVSAAQDLAQKSPRIKLDITLKAPVIVVPQSSTSDNALIIDLGDLHLANRFTAIQSQLSSDPAVIDSMDIKLNSVQVTRSIMKRQRSTADVLVLHPVNISLGLHRNLSASWYRKKPEIDVTAKLQSFSVALSQGDFTMIMSVLNENLTEGTAPPRREDSVVAGAPAQDTPVEEPAGEEKGAAGAVVNGNRTAGDVASTKAETPDKAAVYTKLKFNCQLQQINATLYNGNSNLNEGSATRDAGESLGFFGLHTISVDGVMMSDSSMEANVQLTKCVLDDTRPGREAGITRMMDQSQATATKCPHMIDVAFKQTSTLDKKLNVQVNGLYVCVCLEYLMSVGDFFTKGLPQQPPTTAAASPTDQLATVKPAATNAAQPPPSSQQTGGEMEIQLVVEKPEIILVEDTMDLNTNALVLNTHVVFKLRQTPDQQTMMGIVQNLQVVACRYAPEKREASKILILNPTDISLQSSTPTGDGMHMEIMVTDIIINVSPATIRTITATLSGLTAKPSVGNVDPLDAIPKDLWLAKSIKDVNVWYLKTANEEIDHIGLIEAEEVTESFGRGEQMLMTVSKIVVKFEGGVGNRTLPLLITEMTFRGEVKDWSSKLYVSSELTMEVAYYNETLAVWEPLVEPTEVDNGKLLPWEVNAEVIQNIEAYDTSEDGESATLPLPQTVINVVSDRALEITITKKSLEVINNLSKCFSDAYNLVETGESSDAAVAPYVLCNKSGLDVIATLDKQSFMPYNGNTKLTLATNEPVRLHEPEQEQATSKFSKQSVIKKTQTDVTKRITLQVEQYQFSRDINIVRAERRAFVIHKGNKGSDSFHLVSNTSVSYGCKTVTLGSILTVENNLPYTVEFYNKLSGSTLAKCGEVSSKSEVNVPFSAVYAQPQELYFAIAGQRYGQSTKPVAWSKMSSGSTQVVTCNPLSPDHKAFYFNVTAEIDKIFSEKTDNKTVSVYKLILTPHVVFRNLLPVAVTCLIENNDEAYAVEGGKTIPLHEAKHSTTLDVKIGDYLDKEWRAFLKLDPKTPQMSVCTFEAHENMAKVSMDLGIHCVTVAGSLTFSLYCPYWMVNKTGQQLTYKAGEDFTMMHPPDHQGALLFSFKSQSFVSKNQTSVKVGESDWSEKFSLDTVGSAGTVTCKVKDGQHQAPSNPVKGMVEHLTPFTGTKYKVGVKNTLSSAGLTKIVVFTPYFMLVNHSPFGISVRENSNMAFWVDIPAGECVPFWPALTGKEKMMVAKVQDTDLETPTFKYAEPHTSLLKLDNQYGGINVEVQVMEDSTQIVFQHYQNGSASVLLINHSSRCPVEYVQNNVRDSRQRLSPGDMILYTWQEPSSKRELLWSCGETQNRVDTLVKDGIGDCFYDSDTKMYWVSFLDGMQRVLLFTEDLALATVAQQAGELERVDQEINLSLKGMGLSLVNNDIQKEIAYMAISSSGVVWEMRKKRRYKALKVSQSQQIEAAYQLYVAHIATGQTVQARQQLPGKIDVDFGVEPVMMYKPTKGAIRRSYQNGIQVTYRTSPHQTQFHAKIHRLQLDNQLSGAIFNTVLAPVPPPKSVTAESVPKPFTEVSIMIRKRDYSSVMQFKYAKILIQEMTLKVDQGFINALLALFAAGAITEDERYQQFKEDCKLPFSELGEDAAKSSAGELKNYYDNLHFSPLKIHLSFSLYGASGDDGSAVTQEQKSNVLNIFLQSVGVVLSDIQDVVFKLGYFERNYSFYNQSQLTSEIGGHYAQQAIKQMYVLVLGLDVLGNPFGLIRGMAEGIEDLFYEPYQGAIQGPEEFAEGLALGVRSLFGHAVGGAAGAVSRITGALGKGIATLTLDDDYQKQRREALAKRPTDFKEGFARGGKGLVMGVVGGVTGIVTKPMEGAKQEGVEGFFKGMGKGLVGAFTRPASGMVDFASTSFEGIRRAAELSEEVRRLRPPRYIQKDAIIRPYNFVQAEGNDILKDLEKGAYAKTDMYVYHVIVTKDMKNVLLVTNKRVVFVNKGEFLGQWDCEWQYTWNELKEPPTLTSKGLQFLLKEKQKKSFFSSGTVGKIVPIPNAQMAEIITKRIHEVMQQQA